MCLSVQNLTRIRQLFSVYLSCRTYSNFEKMDSPKSTTKKSQQQKKGRFEDTITKKARGYFEKISDLDVLNSPGKTHVCSTCDAKINGAKGWNLAQHLQHCHANLYDEIAGEKETPEVKRLKFLQNCVEIVSVNARPFASLLDSGFQNIVKDTLHELHLGGYGINLSHPNLIQVKNHLQETAQLIQDEIKKETKDRPLSLLVDIATRNRRSICGFSVQYILNGERKVRSIGMVELLEAHTGKYIAKVIIDRLKEFGISLCQILTITTDNASNILKMVRDIQHHLQSEINCARQLFPNDQNESREDETTNEDTDALIEQVLSSKRNTDDEAISDDEAIARLCEEVQCNENHSTLLNNMTSAMASSGADMWNVTSVHCAAHTLQLAVKDALSKLDKSFTNVIDLCRDVSKFLRLKSTSTALKAINMDHIIPRLEGITRWGSTYLMVRYFSFFLFVQISIYILIDLFSLLLTFY